MRWQDQVAEGKEIVLGTVDREGAPHAAVVISNGLIEGQLLVSNCQLQSTAENLRRDSRVCIVAGWYRIKGRATIHTDGPYFRIAVERNLGPEVREAITVTIEDIFDMDKLAAIDPTAHAG